MLQRVCRLVLPLLSLVVALGVYRLSVGALPQPADLALTRQTPWKIAPLHNEPLVATDSELLRILARVAPPAQPVSTNHFVHALRLWGTAATFDAPETPDGQALRDYFLRDEAYQRWAGAGAPPIFERTHDNALRARFFDDAPRHRATASHHTDDLLATLAESGITLDTPLLLRAGQATVSDLAASALSDFYLARHEFEWTIIAYARYAAPMKRWKNKYGELIAADDLVHRLVDAPLGVGPCNGLHRLEAMVVLYRADEHAQVLSQRARRRLLDAMRHTSELLVHSQSDEGFWTRSWPKGSTPSGTKDSVYDKLLVTGHHLEWLALAPAEVHPPRETIVRAARWTAKTILEISDKDLQEKFGPFSHAARALCLWRGEEAAEIWARRPNVKPQGAAELPPSANG